MNDFEITTFMRAQVTKTTVEDREWKITRSANTKLTKLIYVCKSTELRDRKRFLDENKGH